MLRLLIAFLFLFTDICALGQTPEQYRRDIAALKTAYEKNYPSLYRFQSKKQIDNFFDSCYRAINERTTPESFYATIKFVISYLGDGHMSSSPSPALLKLFQEQWKYFPTPLVFLNDRAYTICEDKQLPRGAEILFISNIPVSTIVKKLYGYIASDGKSETGKNYVLNTAFWFYYRLVYGPQQAFTVMYKRTDGKINSATLYPELRSNIACAFYAPPVKERPLTLSYVSKNIALLTISTFSHKAVADAKMDFSAFLDSAFNSIKSRNIHKLIIDLRGNGGGADVYGAYLYSYLTDKPFRYYAELLTATKKLTVADHPNLGVQQPNAGNYSGRLFFLINGLSFSATAEFCSVAKSNSRGLFIGEETGGMYDGNTSGGSANALLPNTQIAVSIPSTKYIMAVKKISQRNRGIIPDRIVIPSITDIIRKNDVQLNYAIKMAMAK